MKQRKGDMYKREFTFPKILDNAKVLFYTPKDDYGEIYYTNSEIADYIKYLAICKYQNDKEEYYLFKCDENFEVASDSVWESIDECMGGANSSYGGNILWIEAE